MGIQVRWADQQQTALHYELEGAWTLEDLHNTWDHEFALLAGTDHAPAVILDLRATTQLPSNIRAVSTFIAHHIGAGSRILIIVTNNRRVETLMQLLTRVTAKKHTILFADTPAHARGLLAKSH